MAAVAALRASSDKLLAACKQGSLPIVKPMADQLFKHRSSSTNIVPLGLCLATGAKNGHAAVVDYLLQAHSFRYANQTHERWDPPLWFSWKALPKEWVEAGRSDIVLKAAANSNTPAVMQLLLDAGMPVNYETDKEGPPLAFAIESKSVDMVKFLLQKGADPEGVVWPSFITFLEDAASRSSPEIIEALLEHGAPLKDQGALHGAAAEGNLNTAEFLLKRGLDVNEKASFAGGVLEDDEPGNDRGTALHSAVAHGQIEMVNWLLTHGADSSITNGNGKTPADVAGDANRADIVDLLK